MGEAKPPTAPLTRLGRYELTELLGRGGMAEVYKAKLSGAMGTTRWVAVKRILPAAAQDPESVALFVREAKLCSRMTHPNLINVLELGQEENELFLAMELVEGPDLRKVLNAHLALGKPLPLEFVIPLANGMLRGLDSAHRLTDEDGQPLGLVHRDLSPANVLLSYDGAIKVADFGVAHAGGAHALRDDEKQVKGKLQYMAPEQLTQQSLDIRVDVFAAGCVLYELLSGRQVYPGGESAELMQRVARAQIQPLIKWRPDLAPGLLTVVQKALAASPDDRYATCEQFATDLSKLATAGLVPAAPESELGLYLSVLVPKQPFRAELDHTPSAAGPSAPIDARLTLPLKALAARPGTMAAGSARPATTTQPRQALTSTTQGRPAVGPAANSAPTMSAAGSSTTQDQPSVRQTLTRSGISNPSIPTALAAGAPNTRPTSLPSAQAARGPQTARPTSVPASLPAAPPAGTPSVRPTSLPAAPAARPRPPTPPASALGPQALAVQQPPPPNTVSSPRVGVDTRPPPSGLTSVPPLDTSRPRTPAPNTRPGTPPAPRLVSPTGPSVSAVPPAAPAEANMEDLLKSYLEASEPPLPDARPATVSRGLRPATPQQAPRVEAASASAAKIEAKPAEPEAKPKTGWFFWRKKG